MIPFDGVDGGDRDRQRQRSTVSPPASGRATSTRAIPAGARASKPASSGSTAFDEGDMTQPFGGYKQSGNARDKCFDSIMSYTQIEVRRGSGCPGCRR